MGEPVDRLLVVGAGPKAMAVAAKSHVLRELGLPAPQVIVVESHAVGGNWLSSGGWTDGRHRLGTSPEKDVGFPYRSTWSRRHNSAINDAMMAFSWTSFLVERGMFAEWIDRGRPSPQHHVWAKYLQWVARKTDVELVLGSVRKISAAADGWLVSVIDADGVVAEIDADRLMITGPGDSGRALVDHPKVLSIADFWDLAGRRQLPVSSRAAVIGGGETGGSAMDELVRHDVLTVSVISPSATIYTRGESYFENSLYSDPVKWRALSIAERRDVVRRTDRGVFSVRVQENLLGDSRVHHLQGRVVRVVEQGEGIALTLRNEQRPDQVHAFDLVVDATGGSHCGSWTCSTRMPRTWSSWRSAGRSPRRGLRRRSAMTWRCPGSRRSSICRISRVWLRGRVSRTSAASANFRIGCFPRSRSDPGRSGGPPQRPLIDRLA